LRGSELTFTFIFEKYNTTFYVNYYQLEIILSETDKREIE